MTRQHAHRIVIVEDQERPLIWFEPGHPKRDREVEAIERVMFLIIAVGIIVALCAVPTEWYGR
jgi:hypothetical protein